MNIEVKFGGQQVTSAGINFVKWLLKRLSSVVHAHSGQHGTLLTKRKRVKMNVLSFAMYN